MIKNKISKHKVKEVVLVIEKEQSKYIEKYKIFSNEDKAIEFTKNDSYIRMVLDKPMKIGTSYEGQDFQMIKVVMNLS